MPRRTLVTALAIVTIAVLALCVWLATPSAPSAVSAANAAVVGPQAAQARAGATSSPTVAPTQVATSVAPDITATAATTDPASEASAATAEPTAAAPNPNDPDVDGVPAVSTPGVVRLVSNTDTTFTIAWAAATGPVAGYLVTLNGALAATGPATQVTLPWPLTQGNVVVQVYAQASDGERSDASALIVVPPAPASTAVAQPSAKAGCSAPATTAPATPTPRPTGTPTRTPTSTPTASPTPTVTPTASTTATPSASATASQRPAGCGAVPTATGGAATPSAALARP